jgi:U32 family peptidase
MPHAQPTERLELLAPAGDAEAVSAALAAGADALYFGVTTLNARRRARNLHPAELPATVARIHAHHARAYLTLNTDITEREVGQAARLLELARRSAVDAVLVRDPAMLLLRPLFPELEFHFSTQACGANHVDVSAARLLGLDRVVLARELTLAEVAAASAVPGVATEVFVQGALCYCVSGRCLLSSWGGGRSGNRGLCTSPCRVPWRVGDSAPGQLLSMRDLSALDHLTDLARAGVRAVKIEGRMKTAAWVHDAVTLYRQALGGAPSAALQAATARLGAYTGRQMTSGYLGGQREHLTGAAGREGASTTELPPATAEGTPEPDVPPRTYMLALALGPRGICCACECAGHQREWDLPRTQVRRHGSGVTAAQFLQDLAGEPLQGFTLAPDALATPPELVLAPGTLRGIREHLSAFLHQCRREPAGEVRLDLPEAVRCCLERTPPHPANTRALGELPDRIRLDVAQAASCGGQFPGITLIIEGAATKDVGAVLDLVPAERLIVALPTAVFADRLTEMEELVRSCAAAGVRIEANTWGGMLLAREAGARWESGPALPVLNSLAARMLQSFGAAAVALAIEADRRQLEDVCGSCPAPASLVVYGRPALLTTRVELPASCLGQVFEDRRGIRMVPRLEAGLTVYRPVEPFSIRHCHNSDIRVAHLVADLVAAPDPVREWETLKWPGNDAFTFNYGRTLS